MSTTSRKPPTPPAPKLTRPLAQQPPPKHPLTHEVMQRIRKAIRDSAGKITLTTFAADIDCNPKQAREWVSILRAAPVGDALIKSILWLVRHDPTFNREFLKADKIVSVGIIGDLRG